MSRRRPSRRAAPPRARRRSEWSVAEPPRSTHAHPWRGGTGELKRYEDAHCPSGRVPRKADRDYSCSGLRKKEALSYRRREAYRARAASSTSSACPGTFTLDQTRATLPCRSSSTVVRSTPMYLRPYIRRPVCALFIGCYIASQGLET